MKKSFGFALLFFVAIGCDLGPDDYTDLKRACTANIPLFNDAICSTPVFAHTEPLPEGTHPQELVTPEGHVIYCKETSDVPSTYHKRFEDGTAMVTYSNYSGSTLEQLHLACDVSPDFPEVRSSWVVTEDNYICDWADIMPGIIFCAEILEFPGPGEDYRDAVIGEVEPRQFGGSVELLFDPNASLECELIEE